MELGGLLSALHRAPTLALTVGALEPPACMDLAIKKET